MPELLVSPEYMNTVSKYGVYLGGFFETASTIGIYYKSADGVRYPAPFMGIYDNSKCKIDAFQGLFGGSKHEYGNSWRLTFRIEQAAVLAASLMYYAPSKAHTADIVSKWQDMSWEDRNKEKELLDKEKRDFMVKTNAYQKLVEDPNFVAGVLDNRAIILIREGRKPIMRVFSKNIALLNALADHFGGEVEVDRDSIKTRSDFMGVDEDHFQWFGRRWVVDAKELEGILNVTTGHHLLIQDIITRAFQSAA